MAIVRGLRPVEIFHLCYYLVRRRHILKGVCEEAVDLQHLFMILANR